MTVTEMHDDWAVLADKVDSFALASFDPAEIDLMLNRSQDELVKTRYSGQNLKGVGAEEIQVRWDDLRIVTENLNLPRVDPNGEIDLSGQRGHLFGLPVGYWYSLGETARVTFTECGIERTDWFPVKVVGFNQFNKNIRIPFKRPKPRHPVRLMTGNLIQIFAGQDSNVLEIALRYIRQPRRINIFTLTDAEFPEHLHQQIVNGAVRMALEYVKDERLNTFVSNQITSQE